MMCRDGNRADGGGGDPHLNTVPELSCVLCKSISVQLIYNRKLLTARRCERVQCQYWVVLATQTHLKNMQCRAPCLGVKLLAKRSYGFKDKIQWDL
jgi:hypothetical protein